MSGPRIVLARRVVVAAVGATFLALALTGYWPALHGGLLWDDPAHITQPKLASWSGLVRIWTEPHVTQQYYPVLYSAFWFEHRLWGDNPLGYHLVNVGQHALAALLFALLLRKLWSSRARPITPGDSLPRQVPAGAEWIAAALFLVHPVCVESVAWISEQKNTLSLVLYLCAALAYLRFEASRRARWYGAASALFLLAVGTKTVTATLPAALLVACWWRSGRVSFRREVAPLLPWFAAAAVAGVVTARMEYSFVGAQGETYALSMGERVLLASRVIWFYLGKLAWPADLMFIYPRWDVAAARLAWLPWLAGAVGVTILLWMLRRRTRGPLAVWLFFVGSLFPALGFINVYPFAFSYVADHFQYLPSLGVFAGVGVALAGALTMPGPVIRGAAAAVTLFALAAGVALSHRQSSEYRDAVTLYRATLARNPDCWLAHNNLAAEIEDSPGRASEALRHYAEAVRLNPRNAEVQNNYGNVLTKAGRGSEAVSHFEAALRLDPTFLPAMLNLASALAAERGRLTDALRLYRAAIRQDPENAEIHQALATTLASIPGAEDDAAVEFDTALRLLPDHAAALAGRAELLTRMAGRRTEAGADFKAALQLDPAIAKTHYNYGVWLESAGHEAEAVAQYREALRLDPAYFRAQNNLGIIRAQHGDFAGARALWEAALKTDPDFEQARRNLQLLDERTGP